MFCILTAFGVTFRTFYESPQPPAAEDCYIRYIHFATLRRLRTATAGCMELSKVDTCVRQKL